MGRMTRVTDHTFWEGGCLGSMNYFIIIARALQLQMLVWVIKDAISILIPYKMPYFLLLIKRRCQQLVMIASNNMMISEQRIVRCVDGSGCDSVFKLP